MTSHPCAGLTPFKKDLCPLLHHNRGGKPKSTTASQNGVGHKTNTRTHKIKFLFSLDLQSVPELLAPLMKMSKIKK